MNQRYQSEEIRLVSEQYADDELYMAVSTIGAQLESELTEFGLCSEECFMEVREILSKIADKGDAFLLDVENLWLNKYNEYKRFDRHVNDNEIRKVVGIVFGFVAMTIDSSKHNFYRRVLTEKLTSVIANHKFDGWESVLNRIFSVPLSDGWFDDFIVSGLEGENIILPKTLNTNRVRKYFKKAIDKGYMQYANCKYEWMGTDDKANTSQLAYFCGKVFNYKNTICGNAGEDFPEEDLNKLFGVKRLYSSLTQVYNAQKPQRWRSQIDELFE